MKGRTILLHFILVGVVSGYLSMAAMLFSAHGFFSGSSETPSLIQCFAVPLFLFPFYCIFTFPSAVVLGAIYYGLRRFVSRAQTPSGECFLALLFSGAGAACGFVVGRIFDLDIRRPLADLDTIGFTVGALVGFADYFVWRDCFVIKRVA